jgi:lipopolysaccharide/colanic/teichoic acid biosynthesis glycosyltransferase
MSGQNSGGEGVAKRAGIHSRAVVLKYLSDRVVSLLLLVVLSPALLAVATAIRLDSRGPVFFRQERPGRHGTSFRVFKFRTMVQGAEHIGLGAEVSREDDRITRVGKWLRLSSFDEVPQLINVLLGQMSLIGPRPAGPDHAERYTPHQRRRLEAKPGLTGWAQVNGRNLLSWEERIELDIWYVDHWSLWLDLRIVIRTPTALLDTEGVYGPGGITSDLGSSRPAESEETPPGS